MHNKEIAGLKFSIFLWVIPLIVIALMLIADPYYRNMTPSYYEAAANWWAGKPVYTGPSGFNYLPSFLIAFSPFTWLPFTLGEILWRCLAFVGLGLGLWRCCELVTEKNRVYAFAFVTLFALPLSFSALRNGQSSAHLAACLIWAVWCMGRQKWTLATLFLCLSLVCKPLGIPAIGLAAMAFPQLRWRLLAGTALVIVAPYFTAPATYVSGVYAAFANNIINCADTSGRTFADLNGVLEIVNLKLSGTLGMGVRAVAGMIMALTCFFIAKFEEEKNRGLLWLGFTGSYIMLFTPMNELNSYVMLAPALALWAWWYLERGEVGKFRGLTFVLVTNAWFPHVIGMIFGKDTGSEFGKFWFPLMTLVFLAGLFREVIITRSRTEKQVEFN